MKKKIIKTCINYLVLFLIIVLVFSLGMIISYSLPNTRIRNHIKESKDYILAKDNDPIFKEYIKNDKLDCFTDLLILNTSFNKGKTEDESVIIRAVENSRYSEVNGNQFVSLEELMDDDSIYNNQEYSRYWHGIQTILRPLLLFLNFEEIIFLLIIVMNILLVIAAIYINKNLSVFHAIAFVFSMIAVGFFIVPISLQYIGAFAITLVSIIIINILFQKNLEKYLPYLFFIIGGLTVFFDLLTVPALTLGISLIIMILLKNKKENNLNIIKTIFEVIKLSIIWCISYIGVFVSKWVIASIVLKRDAITVAINNILFRVNGSEEYPITRFGAISENFSFLINNVLIALIFISIIACLICMIKYKKNIKDMKIIIVYIMISLYPYVWYFVFAGHSTIHAWFTFRLQAITIFAILCILIECIGIKYKSRLIEKETKKIINN